MDIIDEKVVAASAWESCRPLEDQFPIMPSDINTSVHFWGAFDNSETEVSARWLVSFAQQRDQGWKPFTKEEINDFYHLKGISKDRVFTFNRLINPEMVPPDLARAFMGYFDPLVPKGGGWIIKSENDTFLFTPEFIIRCYQSSPLKK